MDFASMFSILHSSSSQRQTDIVMRLLFTTSCNVYPCFPCRKVLSLVPCTFTASDIFTAWPEQEVQDRLQVAPTFAAVPAETELVSSALMLAKHHHHHHHDHGRCWSKFPCKPQKCWWDVGTGQYLWEMKTQNYQQCWWLHKGTRLKWKK